MNKCLNLITFVSFYENKIKNYIKTIIFLLTMFQATDFTIQVKFLKGKEVKRDIRQASEWKNEVCAVVEILK